MQRECAKMCREVLGPDTDHFVVASALMNLAEVLYEFGKLEEAESTGAESLRMFGNVCDVSSSETEIDRVETFLKDVGRMLESRNPAEGGSSQQPCTGEIEQ